MNYYNDIKKALSQVQLYDVDHSVYLKGELEGYSAGLENLGRGIGEIIKEIFISTAEEEGLLFYENLIGLAREGIGFENRREAILSMINLNESSNTLNGVIQFFESFGFECEITENPSVFDLYIQPLGEDYTNDEKIFILELAKDYLPCHLSFTIDFRKMSWQDYDEMEKTFAQIDQMKLRWEEFEIYDF